MKKNNEWKPVLTIAKRPNSHKVLSIAKHLIPEKTMSITSLHRHSGRATAGEGQLRGTGWDAAEL